MRTRYVFPLVVVLCLPLLLLRDFTPDNELRYLSIADEALRNGTLFTFSNHGVPYADKPPLYLWLLMLCRWLCGGWQMWVLGLLSLLPTLITVAVMAQWVGERLTREHRLTAMAVLLTSALFTGAAVIVRMDALMTMFIVLSVRTFYNMYKERGNRRKQRIVFPLYIFLALFTKGPLGIIIPLMGITLFLLMRRELKRWTEFFGIATWGALLLLCTLWFTAVYIEGGSSYLSNLLFHQTMDRAVNAFHHKRPLWYYCVAVLYSVAPWTLLLAGIIGACVRQRLFKSDVESLFLAMTVATFVVLTCISSKLAIYLLPMLPFTVYLAMMRLCDFEHTLWARLSVALPVVIFAVALPVTLVITSQEQFACYRCAGVVAAAAVLSVAGALACVMLLKQKPLAQPILTTAFGLGLAVFTVGLSARHINPTLGYGSVCREATLISTERNIPILVDKNIKNATDMNVYLSDFKVVNVDSINQYGWASRAVLITRGDKHIKLKCKNVDLIE